MNCCVTDLRYKEVINNADGTRLGCVNDVEIDTCTGSVVAIVIYGQAKCFGLFGRTPDIKICWNEIEVIGDDTVLVCGDSVGERGQRAKRGIFEGFFRT